MPNLWPTDLFDTISSPPITPVIQQADLLAQRTNSLVTAHVSPVNHNKREFAYDFELVVQVLDYRFTLFTIEHGVEGYPVILSVYSKIIDELYQRKLDGTKERDGIGASIPRPQHLYANDEGELLQRLSEILGSDTTRNILRTLIAQAQQFKRRGV